jgi:polyhydroxybutyrate depolymerase
MTRISRSFVRERYFAITRPTHSDQSGRANKSRAGTVETCTFAAVRVLVALMIAACGSSPAVAIDATTDTPSAPFPDAGPCGMRSGMRTLSHRSVHVANLDRTYLVYLPPGLDPRTPIPLVFMMHGYSMSGQDMYDVTGYAALADTEHIAVAFPDGQGGPNTNSPPWNVGSNVCTSFFGPPPSAAGDDNAFLDAMKADISNDQCLDPQHVYVSGFSMGGYFSHHAGCTRPDIRAIAPHSGGTHPLTACANAHRPVIIFHGTADNVIPLGCDDPNGPAVQGTTASATAWAAKNGCATTTHTINIQNGSCDLYDGCPSDGQVEICRFNGMGHCWAGGVGTSLFACGNYESATRLEWQFFKDHAW